MGPNGSIKRTLAQTLAGCSDYIVKPESVTFDDADLPWQHAEERARDGFFLAFH